MGYPERAAHRSPKASTGRSREDRYAGRAGRGSNEPLYDPCRHANAEPVWSWPARTDPAKLLGRTVLESRVQEIFRELGFVPRCGGTGRARLSRSYLARDAGVEIAADTHGTIVTVFLHFHGDDGFDSYCGEIPGGGGTEPRRSSLRAALGRPERSGGPFRDRYLGEFGPWDRWVLPAFVLHAQYGLDGERLHRVTVTMPDGVTPDTEPRAA
jgi:hypothetical protein